MTTQPVNVGSADQPSLEILAKLQPDLIVGEAGSNQEIYALLSQITPTLLWDIRTQQGQWQKNLRALALALGDESSAEKAIAQSLQASQAGQIYFSTYLLWNGLNGPVGTELVLEQLRQFLLSS